MNIFIITGRLVRDPEMKQANSGTNFTKFTVAVDRPPRGGAERQSDFFNCTAFGKTAEVVANYFKKGSRIGVEGSLQTGSYTNNNGQKVNTIDVMVNRIEFLDAKKQTSEAPAQTPLSGFGQAQPFDETIPF